MKITILPLIIFLSLSAFAQTAQTEREARLALREALVNARSYSANQSKIFEVMKQVNIYSLNTSYFQNDCSQILEKVFIASDLYLEAKDHNKSYATERTREVLQKANNAKRGFATNWVNCMIDEQIDYDELSELEESIDAL